MFKKETNNMFTNNVDEFTGNCEANVNEARHPVVFVVDASGSNKPFWPEITNGMKECREEIKRNDIARRTVDTAIIAYNDNVIPIQDWCTVDEMKDITIKPEGRTNMAEALELAIEMLDKRRHLYKDIGIPCKTPYLVHLTDCYNNMGDLTKASNLINERVAEGNMKIFNLCVNDYSKEIAAQISAGGRVFEIDAKDGWKPFYEFFHFVSELVVRSSMSAPGEKVEVRDLTIGQEGSDVRIVNPNLELEALVGA